MTVADVPDGDARPDVHQWARRLTQALQILDLTVDPSVVDELAAASSAAVGPEVAPLTAFVVGYAAGQAAATGSTRSDQAVGRATQVALRLCAETHSAPANAPDAPDAQGWLNTAQ